MLATKQSGGHTLTEKQERRERTREGHEVRPRWWQPRIK